MIRYALATILSFLATPIFAAITSDDLQDLIFQNDLPAVNAALKQAHQQSLTGEISYDELRDLTLVLFRTHPDTVDFLARWLEEEPTSPYANAARVWALYNNAWMVRGSKSSERTPMKAFQVQSEMYEEAMDHTIIAYEAAPDYVPASDAIFRLQWATNRLWALHVKSIIHKTLQATPNVGSIVRISYGNQVDPFELCATYATEIENLSVEACNVVVIAENGWWDGNWNYVAETLDHDDNPVLDYARARRAIELGLDVDQSYLIDYLDTVDLTYPWLDKDLRIASSLANLRYFFNPPRDAVDAFKERAKQAVYKQLETDPFNNSLLKIASLESSHFRSNDTLFHNPQTYKHLMVRKALVQPYHILNWSRIRSLENIHPADLNDFDVWDINALTHSDHALPALRNYMGSKFSQYHTMKNAAVTDTIIGRALPDQSEFDATVSCRLARLIRLFEQAANNNRDSAVHSQRFRANNELDAVTLELRKLPACAHIWEADIASLPFAPIEIDRRDSLELPYTPLP